MTTAPGGPGPLTTRLRNLWLAPDLAGVGQRRERRMRLLASAALVFMGAGWGVFFGLQGHQVIALAELVPVASGLGVLYLTLQGHRRSANLLLFGSMAVVVAGMATLFDVPSAHVPRSVHLYLLPLAVAAFMAFRDDPAWLRYGMAASCLALFVALDAHPWRLAEGYDLPGELRQAAIWVQATLAMALMLMLLHILQTDAAQRSWLDRDLQAALRQEQFTLHFQPQLDRQGRVTSAEVLIRWQHPVHGLLRPAEFIRHAEHNGMIVPIGQWALAQTCATLRDWQTDPDLQPLVLAVNVSQNQFRQADFAQQVRALVQAHGVNAERLELELTETLIVQDVADLRRKMDELVALGVRFALDDFGTGFSSLSHLQHFPLAKLKIDRSFTSRLPDDPGSAVIVRSVIGLGHGMQLAVVAEGLETEAQHRFMLDHGCDGFQGYWFSQPLPLDAFAAFVRQRNRA